MQDNVNHSGTGDFEKIFYLYIQNLRGRVMLYQGDVYVNFLNDPDQRKKLFTTCNN